MINQFIPYSLALHFRIIGFKEKCFAFFDDDGTFFLPIHDNSDQPDDFGQASQDYKIAAPTFQQAIDWVLNQKGIFIEIFRSSITFKDNIRKYQFNLESIDLDDYIYQSVDEDLFYEKYEDARLAALETAVGFI